MAEGAARGWCSEEVWHAACPIRKRRSVATGIEDGFRVCKGSFVGIVRPYQGHYEFLVLDTRREEPTIHGNGVDFLQAVTAVTRLLNALAEEPRPSR